MSNCQHGSKCDFPSKHEIKVDCTTVWRFHEFSITQILGEINFWDSRSAKSAILTHFEALNFDFYEFLHLMKAEIH